MSNPPRFSCVYCGAPSWIDPREYLPPPPPHEACAAVGHGDPARRLGDGEMPPPEVVAAANLVGRWFAERNVTAWKLGPCENRHG